MCASHGASISILPATFTLERKQYQPCGLLRRMVLLPITLTAGRTRMSDGFEVGASLPEEDEPTPKTFTPVARTVSGLAPGWKGEVLPQEAMQPSTADWSSPAAKALA